MATSKISGAQLFNTLFNTATDVTSDTTVSLTSPSAGYSFFLAKFNTSASDPTSSRINVICIRASGYYPLAIDNTVGSVRLSIGDNTFRVISQTGFPALYLIALYGIR